MDLEQILKRSCMILCILYSLCLSETDLKLLLVKRMTYVYIRLVGKDNGVVLFHLDQVWVVVAGKFVLMKDVMKKPLQYDYLPVGTLVSLSVRKLPCSANSQLRYQVYKY